MRWVKHIFVSILDRMSPSYRISGAGLRQVVRDDSFLVWRGRQRVCPGPRIRGPGQTRGQTAPVRACRDCVQCRSLVVDNGGFFIPGPAVVEIFDDNRPMFRCFCFPPGWSRLLFPEPEMAEDAFYHGRLVNQADDFHLMAAAGTSQGVHLPDLLNQVPPAF